MVDMCPSNNPREKRRGTSNTNHLEEMKCTYIMNIILFLAKTNKSFYPI
jgi:hypothetical protein